MSRFTNLLLIVLSFFTVYVYVYYKFNDLNPHYQLILDTLPYFILISIGVNILYKLGYLACLGLHTFDDYIIRMVDKDNQE